MKVYTVIACGYRDNETCGGVFTTLEKAQARATELEKEFEYAEIYESNLDSEIVLIVQ